jgi:Uma2 family endonuclease
LQPDLSFLSNDRSSIDDGKKLNGAPDLVVEVLSEATEERDRTFKFREYARGGAKEYWIVDPDRKRIEVYANSPKGFQLAQAFGEKEVLNTPLFPSVNMPLEKIFKEK